MDGRQVFKRFVLPAELDVQVPLSAHSNTVTDLDNIMRYVAPAFSEELLAPEAYLHGYRIYTVKPQSSADRKISVKIMAEGELRRFENRMEDGLKAGKKWLERRFRYY
jgi:hypothetical protein